MRYFTAINERDYQAFVRLLDAQEAALWTPARFAAGYGTTVDSAETLTGIADRSGGREAASVTFTSHQAPSASPDGSSCDLWSITLYLIPTNSGYVIEHPPSGYFARVRACLPGTSWRSQPGSAAREGRASLPGTGRSRMAARLGVGCRPGDSRRPGGS